MAKVLFNYHQLRKYKIGQIVADTAFDSVTDGEANDIGHIIGLGANVVDEVLLKVDFIRSGVRLIHPSNTTIISKD